MKNLICILLLLCSITNLKSQEFSFPMYFEDSIGNKDTIILGMSQNATMGIDTAFGEFNIMDDSLKNGLDVRASNITRSWLDTTETFQTKKQIIDQYWRDINIDVFTKNYPVTASWDSSLFQQNFLKGTIFTAIEEGFRWDAHGGSSDLYFEYLKDRSSVTFTSNALNGLDLNGYIIGNDTISVYWLFFSDTELTTSIKESKSVDKINVYPNPFQNQIYIDGLNSKEIKKVEILDINGQILIREKDTTFVNTNRVKPGIYNLRVYTKDKMIVKTIIKI